MKSPLQTTSSGSESPTAEASAKDTLLGWNGSGGSTAGKRRDSSARTTFMNAMLLTHATSA